MGKKIITGVSAVVIGITGMSWFFLLNGKGHDGNDLFTACANAEIPDVSVDTVLTKENNSVAIFWSDPATGENKSLLLPYDPTGIYEGCSNSARRVLQHVSRVDDANSE